MQLRRLAALERKKIQDEYAEVIQQIAYLEDLLANPHKILFLVKEDMKDLKEKYGDERRTRIVNDESGEFTEEDLIPDQEVVVTVTTKGYAKRLPVDTYRSQGRGGRGIQGLVTGEADIIRRLLVAGTHDSLLFFTNRGRVFSIKTHELPEASRQAKGLPVINLFSINTDETVTAALCVPSFEDSEYLVMATKMGEVKRTSLSDFSSVRRNGLIAMDLEPGDELRFVRMTNGHDELVMVTEQGQAIRFSEEEIRISSRTSGGVRGIRLEGGASVAGMEVVRPKDDLLVVAENGFGKRTPLKEYPQQGRGGKGVKTINITPKTGKIVAARVVTKRDELMIISSAGIVIRLALNCVRSCGRASQGVSLMSLKRGAKVAAIAEINAPEEVAGPPAATCPPDEKPGKAKKPTAKQVELPERVTAVAKKPQPNGKKPAKK
jgi:DNA gyrase subunit A